MSLFALSSLNLPPTSLPCSVLLYKKLKLALKEMFVAYEWVLAFKLKIFVCFGRDVGEVVTFFEPLVQILQKMIVRNS